MSKRLEQIAKNKLPLKLKINLLKSLKNEDQSASHININNPSTNNNHNRQTNNTKGA